MTVKEKILAIRLAEKINKYPLTAQQLQINTQLKSENNKKSKE